MELEERLSRAQKLKEEGNALFGELKYVPAIEFYTQAIELLHPSNLKEKEGESENESESEEEKTNSHSPSQDTEESENLQSSQDSIGKDETPPQNSQQKERKSKTLADLVEKEFHDPLAVFYANRSACHAGLENWEKTVEDATLALELKPSYCKALLRRAKAYESLQKLRLALKEQLEPSRAGAERIRRLAPLAQAQEEQEKAEMIGLYSSSLSSTMKSSPTAKLKEVGNSFLGLFGLSTDNFQMTPDSKGGYSVNFKQ